MRLAIVLAAVLSLSGSAFAGGHGGGEATEKPDGDLSIVEMPMLVAPVAVNDRLYHYAYMRVVLKAASADIAKTARDKIPFILDEMLRETHRSSIALGDNPESIDGDGLKTRLLASANKVMGKGSFLSLNFRDTIQTDDPVANQEMAEQARFDALMTPAPKPAAKSSAHH